jgi:hypothetical protein
MKFVDIHTFAENCEKNVFTTRTAGSAGLSAHDLHIPFIENSFRGGGMPPNERDVGSVKLHDASDGSRVMISWANWIRSTKWCEDSDTSLERLLALQ